MSKDTDKSLFIVSSMPRLYQQLFSGVISFEALGNRIIGQIKAAHAFRQVEKVRGLARILINIPIKEYQLIAQYYLVWCQCRKREYNTEPLERIIDQTSVYKAKGLLSCAAFEGYKGNTDSELYFCNEAMKAFPTASEYIDISKAIAVVKAKEGFHKSAIKDLENIIPIIRHAEPQVYFDVLNSYAVELGEVGRLDEAENVSRITIASPFAPYYPEWRSTFSGIRSNRKRRSTITISLPEELFNYDEPPSNVVPFPMPQASETETVLDMSQGIDMAPLELLSLILKVVLKNRITEDEIEKICTVYYETVMKLWGE